MLKSLKTSTAEITLKPSGTAPGNTMNGKQTATTEIPRSVRISMVSVFSASAIAASYARPVALNVEPMSLIVFMSGIALGSRLGATVGFISMFVYSNFNPLGPAPIFVFLAQIGCMAIFGLVGGVFSRSCHGDKLNVPSSLKMGAAGAYLTIVFDFVTNLAWFLSGTLGLPFVLIGALYFMVVHVVSNTLFFSTVGPVVSRHILKTIRGEGI